MNFLARLLPAATLMIAVATTGAVAQENNPNQSGGLAGAKIAMPNYPAGNNDPALSPGVLPPGAAEVPPADNPNVAGATGMTVVPGDRSTISGDRQGTIEQKTGAETSADTPG